ncbi:hypothetical protein PYCCODRAFT_1299593 [Trametes coccinea BRFM310]|uniref:Uncharacterized protein n=1 Tax=Trametes coccinea (strain BRFM310) TaxID=1353009 RepID=A0A1Y2IZ12_TRAC3|nr:hypothetical protein PYCCODRAFT_1299593 [Trametes coccinea BRFM310]
MLEADRCRKDIVTLQSVNREWCFAVRRHRFAKLQLTPDSRPKRLLNVWRPDTLLPHLRQVDIFGGLDLWSQISDEEFDELPLGWLNKLLPLLQQISRHSPLEILRVEDLYWPALTPEIRECLLRGFPHIYALHIMNVDFRNSNQLLRTLNAFPQVQYLWIGDLSYDSQSHTLSQISRTEPLFLREVYLPSAYTGLFLDWLLGQRNTLVVERLRIAVRDLYRDDAKLVRLIRKVGPWLKSLKYLEYSGLEVSQGRVYYREDRCGPAQRSVSQGSTAAAPTEMRASKVTTKTWKWTHGSRTPRRETFLGTFPRSTCRNSMTPLPCYTINLMKTRLARAIRTSHTRSPPGPGGRTTATPSSRPSSFDLSPLRCSSTLWRGFTGRTT